MRRIATLLLTLMLVFGMFFSTAPPSFASEPDSTKQTSPLPTTEPIPTELTPAPSLDEPPSAGQPPVSEEAAQDTNLIDEQQPQISTVPDDGSEQQESVLSTTGSDRDRDHDHGNNNDQGKDNYHGGDSGHGNDQGNDSDNNHGNGNDNDPNYKPALVRLNQALNDLYNTLRSDLGTAVVRLSNEPLTEDAASVAFRAGDSYVGIISQINKINALLDECGLPGGHAVSSLSVVVAGELPKGFSFENNTLTLNDLTLLAWSEELGDEPNALIRTYKIKLQLRTGVSYIDWWLSIRGIDRFITESFAVELQLTTPPADTPTEPVDAAPAEPGDDGSNNAAAAGTTPVSSTPVSATTIVDTLVPLAQPVESETPASEALESNEPTRNSAAVAAIEELQIPTASAMTRDDFNSTAANATLAAISLAAAGASLLFSRQRKPGGAGQAVAAVQLGGAIKGVGVMTIILGVLNPALFIASQYLTISPFGSTIAWTPLLITVFILQSASGTVLFFGTRAAAKKTRPRYKIRY